MPKMQVGVDLVSGTVSKQSLGETRFLCWLTVCVYHSSGRSRLGCACLVVARFVCSSARLHILFLSKDSDLPPDSGTPPSS